ncbi:hypothetical protein BGX27_009267 [Mortierella sp. AM989]|nr:hypothetical protein BGX27_009267 [Mortierella sp. AM989]
MSTEAHTPVHQAVASASNSSRKGRELPKTPEQPFSLGFKTAFASSASDQLSLHQKRKFFAFALDKIQTNAGLGTQEQRAQWATPVFGKPTDQQSHHVLNDEDPMRRKVGDPRGPQGHTWKGYWIPFQDQVHSVKDGQGQENYAKKKAEEIKNINVGEGCDLVVFMTHGGGFVDGYPLQTLGFMLRVMKQAQEKHGIKVGFLSIDYSLSPETPFPGALNECVEAYRSLVKEYSVDPKRIVLGGESAGGNLSHVLSLKLRDELGHELGLPAGVYTVSPYFLDPEPMEHSLYDTLTPLNCQNFVTHYSQHNPEILASQYYSPLNATTLSGLPPMLVYIGGVEILRPSIEKFVVKAKNDGGDIQVVLKEGRGHVWFLIEPASTEQDREESVASVTNFLASIYDKQQQQ